MARFELRNIRNKPFIALPLSLSFSGASSIRIKKIFIENIFNSERLPLAKNFVFAINRQASDYSQATNVQFADYEINYTTISNPEITELFGSAKFKILNEFSIVGNSIFNFEIIFDPFRLNFFENNQIDIAENGNYFAKLHIHYTEDALPRSPIILNFVGTFTEQDIETIDGVNFTNVLSLQTISKNNINIIG
tara:strand:+ start:877 stop:1455 length:579 start_codon:yes stop_codon:yes gene_type:complete